MSDWYEKAEQDICDRYNDGELTEAQFNREMRDLNDELRGNAEEAAAEAYDAAMGGW